MTLNNGKKLTIQIHSEALGPKKDILFWLLEDMNSKKLGSVFGETKDNDLIILDIRTENQLSTIKIKLIKLKYFLKFLGIKIKYLEKYNYNYPGLGEYLLKHIIKNHHNKNIKINNILLSAKGFYQKTLNKFKKEQLIKNWYFEEELNEDGLYTENIIILKN